MFYQRKNCLFRSSNAKNLMGTDVERGLKQEERILLYTKNFKQAIQFTEFYNCQPYAMMMQELNKQ